MTQGKIIISIASFFILFFALFSGCISNEENNIILEMYGIKYGDSQIPSRYIFFKDEINDNRSFSWMFYAIIYDSKIILVDTGFYNYSLVEELKINYTNPLSILNSINIQNSDVTDVIITHGHFDHVGNVYKFPNARIYIQKYELENIKTNPPSKEVASFFESNKNIITFNEELEIYNFFKIEKIGKHTPGSSIVNFIYNNTNYYLVGDECYFLDNCSIEKLNDSSDKIILPYHDPILFKLYRNYRNISKNVFRII